MNKFNYFKPSTLTEASEILRKYGENAHILNGGTDLVVRIREDLLNPEAVVDIKGIEELHHINYNEKEGLTVGACVSLSDMAHNEAVVKHFPVIADSAEVVGSGQIRNLATMVGNNCNASPLADTATPLLALDANLLVYSPEGNKKISIHDFFVGVRKTSLKTGEIVIAIRVPSYTSMKGVFKKASRRKDVDLSTVCTTVVRINNDEIRIALGAVAPTPIRAKKAEGFAKGKDLTDEVVHQIAKLAVEDATPIDDVRGSKEYRLHMVEVLVRRSLEELRY